MCLFPDQILFGKAPHAVAPCFREGFTTCRTVKGSPLSATVPWPTFLFLSGLAAATIVLLAALSFTLLQPYQMMFGWFFDNSSSAQPQDLLAESRHFDGWPRYIHHGNPGEIHPLQQHHLPYCRGPICGHYCFRHQCGRSVYYGDTNKILNQGVGTYMENSGAGLPGEGKTVSCWLATTTHSSTICSMPRWALP